MADAAGLKPTNAAAKSSLSARAVRFYVVNGLIDRPDGKGTAATYGYRHLLQLLAIKIRQREGQTLESIKREMVDVTGDALERRVAQALSSVLLVQAGTPAVDDEAPPVAWRRITVANGIELSVREDSRAASDGTMMAMRDAARSALARDELI